MTYKSICKSFFSLTLGTALSCVSSLGATLSLDLQPTGGTTAAGFLALEESNQVLPTTTHNYSAFSTTVGVRLSVANLPDSPNDFRAVARNGTSTDSFNDWIGVDTRSGGTDVTLSIIISGLPAGEYNWLSEHHDGGSGTGNGNLNGSADLVFTDATGTTSALINEIIMKDGNSGLPVQTYTRNFTSNGSDDVEFSMIMDEGQGGGSSALFAFANSLVITEVPEPSAALLFFTGGIMFILRRRR